MDITSTMVLAIAADAVARACFAKWGGADMVTGFVTLAGWARVGEDVVDLAAAAWDFVETVLVVKGPWTWVALPGCRATVAPE